jgi:CheY-like chemotaxis protein
MHETKQGKSFLVVEDSADDAELIRRAFSGLESCNASICRNLSEARAYVQGAGMYSDRKKYPFPNGIVCDLRLGHESGVDFLKWIKANSQFKDMPVYILAGDANSRDCFLARQAGAVEVLRKPTRFEDLQMMIFDLASKLCA